MLNFSLKRNSPDASVFERLWCSLSPLLAEAQRTPYRGQTVAARAKH